MPPQSTSVVELADGVHLPLGARTSEVPWA